MDKLRVLRALVLSLVIFAMIKIFTRGPVRIDSEVEDLKTEPFWKQSSFEPDDLGTLEDPPKPEKKNKQIDKETEDEIENKTEERFDRIETEQEPEEEEVIENKWVSEKSTGPLYLVHLDLKGAAPKVSYFKQIFPLFSALGASGILIEYEDMFPYEGELQILRSPHAYSPGEIAEIQNLANLSNLEVVPLVQVFGRMEFVLKHEKYLHLREVAQYPDTLSPKATGSQELVIRILKQVLKKHPNIRWLHIGADEVHELGQSEDSKRWLEKNNGNVGALYVNHVSLVCRALNKMRPGMRMVFWEDMLRNINVETIKASGLAKLAFPMIWSYSPNMNVDEIGTFLEKYQASGFTGIWFASAFKGASDIDQRWTPLQHHLGNHLAWLKIMDYMPKFPSMEFQGITLTGWQRYEHFTRLCELLPVAIPSMAVCLQTLKHRSFNKEAENEVQHILGCKIDFNSSNCEGSGAFAGAEIYHMVQKIHNELQHTVDKFMKDFFLRGSLSSYNRKYNFANPRNLAFFKDRMKKTLEDWESFIERFQKEMEIIFYPDTVEEWLEENVNEQMNKLRGLVTDTERIFSLNGRPKSLNVP